MTGGDLIIFVAPLDNGLHDTGWEGQIQNSYPIYIPHNDQPLATGGTEVINQPEHPEGKVQEEDVCEPNPILASKRQL